MRQHLGECGVERQVGASFIERALQGIQRGDERLGNVSPAKNAEAIVPGDRHETRPAARPSRCTASRKARIRSRSLMPGADSTPEETSSMSGDNAATAA